MMYKVIITRRAFIDMDKIHLYITGELHAPQAADNLINDIEQRIINLKETPNKYAPVSDERLARRKIRKIPVNNYLIFYYVDEPTQTVTVVRVLYGARDWINLL